MIYKDGCLIFDSGKRIEFPCTVYTRSLLAIDPDSVAVKGTSFIVSSFESLHITSLEEKRELAEYVIGLWKRWSEQ